MLARMSKGRQGIHRLLHEVLAGVAAGDVARNRGRTPSGFLGQRDDLLDLLFFGGRIVDRDIPTFLVKSEWHGTGRCRCHRP